MTRITYFPRLPSRDAVEAQHPMNQLRFVKLGLIGALIVVVGRVCVINATKWPLSRMDRFSWLAISALVPEVRLLNKYYPTKETHLRNPLSEGKQPVTVVRSGRVIFKNLKEDPNFGALSALEAFRQRILFNDLVFPVADRFDPVPIQDVALTKRLTGLDFITPDSPELGVVPARNVIVKNPQSDEALTQFAFYGIGAHRVKRVRNGQNQPPAAAYELDLSDMTEWKVREGFAKYGTKAYFDNRQNPVAIRNTDGNLIQPGDGYQWELAKAVWRTSLITMVTIVDHLFNVHFGVASQMLRASSQSLPRDHKLRRALHPFLFRTGYINNKAGRSLLMQNSIFEHMSALRAETLQNLPEKYYLKGSEWKPLPDHIKEQGVRLPFYQDGLELWQLFHSFFDSVIGQEFDDDVHLPHFWSLLHEFTAPEESVDGNPHIPSEMTREALLKVLSNFAFHVTAQHELVGSVSEWFDTPLHGGMRLPHGSIQVDLQSFLLGLALLANASLPTPKLMSSFAHYWKADDDNNEMERWEALQEGLHRLSKDVNKRNKFRRFRVEASNPSFLECAVSV